MTFGYRFESGDGLRRYLGESRRESAHGTPGRHLMPLTPNFGASRSQQPSSLFKNPWATALICPHPFCTEPEGSRLSSPPQKYGVGPLGTVTALYART